MSIKAIFAQIRQPNSCLSGFRLFAKGAIEPKADDQRPSFSLRARIFLKKQRKTLQKKLRGDTIEPT
ncbi:hypothetical protein [Paraburkholderia atlantica]|uniref:hypothetical protein n=1 Tax=Paraburkholderia atlantica TaxID=2654982 RepID=UPI001611830C|nr:hypothetical protein [Paraburkholderia atlantica]MBB5510650.1 hypothetical protein [Paraburkholderia atlantica]